MFDAVLDLKAPMRQDRFDDLPASALQQSLDGRTGHIHVACGVDLAECLEVAKTHRFEFVEGDDDGTFLVPGFRMVGPCLVQTPGESLLTVGSHSLASYVHMHIINVPHFLWFVKDGLRVI
jgi:hypothetical protein